jgi:hypothetical protein
MAGPPQPTQELMMVFNAHQNVQRVIETAWSFYLLKYALKVSEDIVFTQHMHDILYETIVLLHTCHS